MKEINITQKIIEFIIRHNQALKIRTDIIIKKCNKHRHALLTCSLLKLSASYNMLLSLFFQGMHAIPRASVQLAVNAQAKIIKIPDHINLKLPHAIEKYFPKLSISAKRPDNFEDMLLKILPLVPELQISIPALTKNHGNTLKLMHFQASLCNNCIEKGYRKYTQ